MRAGPFVEVAPEIAVVAKNSEAGRIIFFSETCVEVMAAYGFLVAIIVDMIEAQERKFGFPARRACALTTAVCLKGGNFQIAIARLRVGRSFLLAGGAKLFARTII